MCRALKNFFLWILLSQNSPVFGKIVFDEKIYRNSTSYARGRLTITQSELADSMYFNPSNIYSITNNFSKGLKKFSRKIHIAIEKLRKCESELNSYSEKPLKNSGNSSGSGVSKICLDFFSEEWKDIFDRKKKVSAKFQPLKDCLKENSLYKCEDNISALEENLEGYRRVFYYSLNADSSKFGFDVARISDENERTSFSIENKGQSAAFFLGHSAWYYNGNSSLGIVQSINLSAIATHDDIQNVTEDNFDGNLALKAVYSKNNILVYSRGLVYEKDFQMGLNLKLLNRSTSTYNASVTDIEKIKNIKSLRNSESSYGAGADLGFNYQPLENISLSAAIVNISDVNFRAKFFNGERGVPLKQYEILGIIWKIPLTRSKMSLAIELEDPTNEQDLTVGQRVRVGGAFCIDWTVCLNTGIFDGYLSAGLSSDSLQKFHYSLVRYTRELSDEIGLRPEIHYALQIGMSL